MYQRPILPETELAAVATMTSLNKNLRDVEARVPFLSDKCPFILT